MSPEHTLETRLRSAQEHLLSEEIDGWLLYDYRGMNPIFADTVGAIANVTRPCWLWVPVSGAPKLLVSYVDQGRFGRLGLETLLWVSRSQMRNRLRELLRGTRVVAMEYSRDGALPRVSWVDAGTVEMVRGLGVEVVSSADTVQYATQRWSAADLLSHRAGRWQAGQPSFRTPSGISANGSRCVRQSTRWRSSFGRDSGKRGWKRRTARSWR